MCLIVFAPNKPKRCSFVFLLYRIEPLVSEWGKETNLWPMSKRIILTTLATAKDGCHSTPVSMTEIENMLSLRTFDFMHTVLLRIWSWISYLSDFYGSSHWGSISILCFPGVDSSQTTYQSSLSPTKLCTLAWMLLCHRLKVLCTGHPHTDTGKHFHVFKVCPTHFPSQNSF